MDLKIESHHINLPNALSFYRILAFPVIMACIWMREEQLFTILLCVNLVTDILDGLIARLFNLETELGARLDSLADIGTYVAAFAGVFVFKWFEMQDHLWVLYAFLAMYILFHVVAFFKFGRQPSLHLYSFKLTGYLQGTFFVVLFAFDFNVAFYYVAMGWGILATLEELVVLILLKEPKSNVKGLYWLLKEPKS